VTNAHTHTINVEWQLEKMNRKKSQQNSSTVIKRHMCVKANSVLRATLTSGFWDIFSKQSLINILFHENTLQTCYHQKSGFYLKMHPKSFLCRALPRHAGGAYSAPPDLLPGFKGPTSKEGKGRVGRGEEGRGGEGKGGQEREGEALGPAPLHIMYGYTTVGKTMRWIEN